MDGSLLLVEDNPIDARIVLGLLERISDGSLDTHWVTSLADAVLAVREHRPSVILADLTLPDAGDLDVVRVLCEVCAPDCSIIVQTGHEAEETALAALELGAQDYLHKADIDAVSLERSIRYAVARSRLPSSGTASVAWRDDVALEPEDFAQLLAHDLRAPVRTARLFADRLLDRLDRLDGSDEVALDFGVRLERSLHRVDQVIFSTLEDAVSER